jgi:hypothetical protein
MVSWDTRDIIFPVTFRILIRWAVVGFRKQRQKVEKRRNQKDLVEDSVDLSVLKKVVDLSELIIPVQDN